MDKKERCSNGVLGFSKFSRNSSYLSELFLKIPYV